MQHSAFSRISVQNNQCGKINDDCNMLVESSLHFLKENILIISRQFQILCEGGSFSPAIFNSDIQVSVFPISCFIYVCPFVALSKTTHAENSHFVLSSRY